MGPAARQFSAAPFPADAAAVGSPETNSYLRNLQNGSEIYLVGTAHVSKASADEVRQLIRLVQPDVVLVELDEGRAARLQSGQSASLFEFLKANLPGVLKPGAQWGSSVVKFGVGGMYQAMRMMGLEPGGEFKAAIEEAKAVRARVVYGDMPVEITSSRIAARIGIWDMIRLLLAPVPLAADERPWGVQQTANGSGNDSGGSTGAGDVAGRVELLKTRKAATAMRDHLRSNSPELAAVLVDERDQFLVEQLRALSGKVVAVVGLAHLDGIEQKWKELQP